MSPARGGPPAFRATARTVLYEPRPIGHDGAGMVSMARGGELRSGMQSVLVTGSAGRIGRPFVRELKARDHCVRGFDLAATPDADESISANLTDAAAVRRAAEGVETLIHLAATPDDDDFL